MNTKEKEVQDKKNVHNLDNYPGVAINVGDDNKNSLKLEKERTKTLNDNPRNNDIDFSDTGREIAQNKG